MTLKEQINQLRKKSLASIQPLSIVGFPAYIYLFGVTCGLNKDEGLKLGLILGLPVVVIVTAISHVLVGRSIGRALVEIPGEPRGARLSRLLELPRRFELEMVLPTVVASGLFPIAAVIMFGKSPWTIPWTVITYALMNMMSGIQIRATQEKLLRPLVLEEFRKDPNVKLMGSGHLWVRQSWYLPYCFFSFVVATLALTLTIIGREGYEAYILLETAMREQSIQLSPELLAQTALSTVRSVALPLGLLGAFLLYNAARAALSFAQNQSEGTQQVRNSLESLVAGSPRPPEWVSTDELGELAISSAKVFDQLKTFSTSLGTSAETLKHSADQLGESTQMQTEVVTRQAAALHETQVTAQEIKQTSALTAQKAEGILKQAEHVDTISRSGEEALQRTMGSLQEIGEQVREMATRIKALDERTRQIANITTTVKDLADQSNMLALNAAIEAVRSGEHGKGFGVVAREIRILADQSIKATMHVRQILQDISAAIRSTVTITEKGTEKVESSLQEIKEFGGNMQQMANIMRENANAVRQISVAVSQQDTGIVQIFQAINDLSAMMSQTVEQFRLSDETLKVVRNMADKVGEFVNNYDWQKDSASATPVTKEVRS